VVAGKALAAFAIFVAGGAVGFAVSAIGWRDSGSDHHGKTASATIGQRTSTLRDGDVVLRPEAATRCRAEREGGIPDLFCDRMPGGRFQVVFYADCVLVWPLSRGPEGPPIRYGWKPGRGCK
jgi:hypothetical protein